MPKINWVWTYKGFQIESSFQGYYVWEWVPTERDYCEHNAGPFTLLEDAKKYIWKCIEAESQD